MTSPGSDASNLAERRHLEAEQGGAEFSRQVAYRAAVVARQACEWADICWVTAEATATGEAPVDAWSTFLGEVQDVVAATVATVDICEAAYLAARAAGRGAAAAQQAERTVAVLSDPTLTPLQAARAWSRVQVIRRTWAADERIRSRRR